MESVNRISAHSILKLLALSAVLYKVNSQVTATCDPPPDIANGRLRTSGPFYNQSVAVYDCDSGYNLEGNARMVCNVSATPEKWNPAPNAICKAADRIENSNTYNIPEWLVILLAVVCGFLIILIIVGIVACSAWLCCRLCIPGSGRVHNAGRVDRIFVNPSSNGERRLEITPRPPKKANVSVQVDYKPPKDSAIQTNIESYPGVHQQDATTEICTSVASIATMTINEVETQTMPSVVNLRDASSNETKTVTQNGRWELQPLVKNPALLSEEAGPQSSGNPGPSPRSPRSPRSSKQAGNNLNTTSKAAGKEGSGGAQGPVTVKVSLKDVLKASRKAAPEKPPPWRPHTKPVKDEVFAPYNP